MYPAIAVERGCGRRKAGKIYWELGFGPGGSPVESFLVDSPQPIDLEALGVSSQGVTLIDVPRENGGKVTHVVDWVGRKFYPNVADYVEEVRRFGLSCLIPRTTDFSRITAESRLLVVHHRAFIANAGSDGWHLGPDGQPIRCPQHFLPGHDNHPTGVACCAGAWWNDVQDGIELSPGVDRRLVTVKMPSFSYTARTSPPGTKPQYQPAVFARFPLGRFVVVEDKSGGSHTEAAELLQNSGHESTIVAE